MTALGTHAEDYDYDPQPSQRVYFRHYLTGDLGWLVRREGKDHIKYDRAGVDQVVEYTPGEWKEEKQHRDLTEAQIAQICFAADKELCRLLGMYDKARQEWASLSDEHRRLWIKQGPTKNPYRAGIYQAIRGALAEADGE